MMTRIDFRGRVPSVTRLALAALLALPVAACEDVLEVQDPEFLTPEAVADSGSIPALVVGAIGDFQVGYSGGGLDDKFLSTTMVMTDETFTAGTFSTRTATDRRNQFPTNSGNTSDAAFGDLHDARRSLRSAAGAVQQFFGADDPRFAELKALEGFTYVALGEAFCEPIPFSQATITGDQTLGEPQSRQQIFEGAITQFDAALGGGGAPNLAAVGKGRALLNLGQYAAAAAAVAAVPTEFVYFIEHSDNTGREENPIFNLQSNGRYSLSDEEGGGPGFSDGGNGLPFRSAMDPRVPWVEDPARGFDEQYPLFIDLRHSSRGTDIPLAGGLEARLIEAEAALNAGDVPGWLAILNDLRANVIDLMAARWLDYETFVPGPVDLGAGANTFPTTLAPLTDPGTPDARVDLMFSERAFWLFTTGHRLGDLRRLVRQYGRTPSSVFPSGQYHKGGTYGVDLNFPVPFDEANNTNYSISSCVVTSA